MFLSDRHSFPHRPARARRRSRGLTVRCEELEPRLQLSVTPFFFSTGSPDGLIGGMSEPDNAHNGNDELETADDFVLPAQTELDQTTFTGLLTGGAQVSDVSNVFIEIYQVFPKDSNSARTPKVPTRVNSPGDVAFVERDSLDNKLSFTTNVLSTNFNIANSVDSTDRIAVGGASTPVPISGAEVQFNVNFTPPLDLAPGQYFFVPHVGLSATAPANSHFLWLSAPLPIQPPGTQFTPDIQAWERFNGLKPDWLRIGADIVGGTPFNESFSLTGQSFTASISSLSPNSAAEGSSNLALTVSGSEFTNQSTVLFNGLPLATTFVNTGQLQAAIPAALLADEGTANVTVFDVQRGLSSAQTFSITDNVPAISASASPGPSRQTVTVSGQVADQAFEGHRVRIAWGDGTIQVIDLGSGPGGPFSASHHFRRRGPRYRTIQVTALDDEGTTSAPLALYTRVPQVISASTWARAVADRAVLRGGHYPIHLTHLLAGEDTV
jgi:uncharacterized protein (TIGR03437 family)